MDPAQMDDRISRMESALQQVMDVTAQGQQDLIRIRQELANVQTGATASPPAPAATETPVPLPHTKEKRVREGCTRRDKIHWKSPGECWSIYNSVKLKMRGIKPPRKDASR
ncbi:unnamed protein product [Boreogadus saida]